MNRITEIAKLVLGSIITAISGFLGGMDGIMYALVAFISIDYITGVAAAAKRRDLSSETGFWGIVRKVCILIIVGVAHIIDINVMGSADVFRTAVALYYIGNEGVSLLENIANLGVKLPKKLLDVLKQIRDSSDSGDKEESDKNADNGNAADSK